MAWGSPQRIASTNLCTDQLVLLIAGAERIISLSSLAADPEYSFMAREASAYPAKGHDTEALLQLQPDLVLVSNYSSRLLVERLNEQGIRVETLAEATSLEDIIANIRQLATWLDETQRGEHLIQQMRQRLAALPVTDQNPRPSALFLQPNGYTSGPGTLQHSALLLAGWRNGASDAQISGYAPLGLEQLIRLQPDALFTSSRSHQPDALALRILNHPALRRIHHQRPPQWIDYRYWICGGPMLVEAVEQLAALRQQQTRQPNPP